MNKYQKALEELLFKPGNVNETCRRLRRCMKSNKCDFDDKYLKDCNDYKRAKTLQELLDRETPMKVIGKDVGYNPFTDENVYAVECPYCEFEIYRAGDNDINVEDPNSECILKGFYEKYDIQQGGNYNYCNNCGQRLDFDNKKGE